MDWIPGEFGYRRLSPTRFVLFAYGSPRDNPTMDLLKESAEEFPVNKLNILPPRTSEDGVFKHNGNGTVQVGNPDGQPDGIIYVITEQGSVTLPETYEKMPWDEPP